MGRSEAAKGPVTFQAKARVFTESMTASAIANTNDSAILRRSVLRTMLSTVLDM
jgi:hypothetical protein